MRDNIIGLITGLLIGVFPALIIMALDTPMVFKPTGSAPVACETPKTGKPIPIADVRCQEVLKGMYDTIIVSNAWEPE